jgi:hypothetical protein
MSTLSELLPAAFRDPADVETALVSAARPVPESAALSGLLIFIDKPS